MWEGVGALVPGECAPSSGRIGRATRPAEMGVQPWVNQIKRKWASQECRRRARSTMEYPLWVSRVLEGRKGAPSRQPEQGTRWGGDR